MRATGWVSVLFSNSSGLVRQGDETNGAVQVLDSTDEQDRFKQLYGPSAAAIIRVCQPAMKAAEKMKMDRKKKLIQARYERDKQKINKAKPN